MRHVIHDWPDDLATAILKNIKHSMKPESRLLIRIRQNFLWKILLSLTDVSYQTSTFSMDSIDMTFQIQPM